MAFNNTVVARAAASIWGLKLGYVTMQAALAQANVAAGGVNSVINSAFNDSFGRVSNADVAANVVANLGLTGAAATEGRAYLVSQMASVPAAERGAKISEVIALFSGLSADPVYGAAASAFNTKVAGAVAHSSTAGSMDAPLGFLPSAGSFFLTLGQDNLTGTPGADTFNAYIFDNSNSLQSADRIDGGAGNDTLFADMGASQSFAVTPITTGVENIVIRAQSDTIPQGGQNNPGNTDRVTIDAERINGATRFESNNSRSDVIIEDVRILPSQITKDITVAWVESDPGHVDYGVYFDQYSLRNQTSASSSINLQIMDTGAAARGEAPLKDSNYRAFTFTVTPPGQAARVVTLGSDAIQAAQTYAELRTAFQAELDREFGAGVATATLGANFTVVDPLSSSLVTGQTIVLTTQSATVFSTPAGSGWLADGVAPPASNFYTNFNTAAASSADLVTVKVLLDDVGRGSTGGDLVIGGLSTGVTSSSLGVQRFEVEVRDNSKLESMKSTNNTLREVVIVNGETSSGSNAYIPTVKNAGTLTVNGNSGANGAFIFGTGAQGGARDGQFGNNTPLPNSGAQTEFGFTDVRLIDGSAMTGQLAFTAEVTNASLAKYLNLRDIQALPAGDNVHFTYNGGAAADAMGIVLDAGVVASRNTIMTGREDFTFTANGGAGNDNITLRIIPGGVTGQSQAWYANQKLNKNVTIDGGDGNDTIRKIGAGDAIIRGGAGTDTIYADNSGVQTLASGGSANMAGAVYTAAEAAELAAAIAAKTLKNNTDAAKAAGVVTALTTLDLVTPQNFTTPVPALPTKANLQLAIDAAVTARALTLQQAIDLSLAYGTRTAGDTITVPVTLVEPAIALTGGAGAGALTAAEFAAGNALLATYITAAKAAAAEAAAAEQNWLQQQTLLNGTQQAVVDATVTVNGGSTGNHLVDGAGTADQIGSATSLAALQALKSALVVGATDAQIAAAITTAWRAGAFGDPDQVALGAGVQATIFTAATAAAGPLDANEIAQIALTLEVLINAANNTNVANTTALTTAITNNNTAVRNASDAAGADPVSGDGVVAFGPNYTAIGATEAESAAAAARTALDTFNTNVLTPQTTLQADQAALKAALAVGVTELNANILINNFAAKHPGQAAVAAQLLLDANAGAPAVGGAIDATEKENINITLTAAQEAQNAVVDVLQLRQANLQSVVTATTFASAQALAASANTPAADAQATSRAVYVVNTANQAAETLTPGTGYVLSVNDERNLNDLKSGADDKHNFFNATVKVTFKGIEATANVPNTGYKTSDLQVNQAIKEAINGTPTNPGVLSKLLVATDGPGNTLVITSLIDGQLTLDNLSIGITLPLVTTLAAVDVSAAAPIYGLAAGATAADVLAAMVTAKTAFDTKGDYVDQWAETGALGNVASNNINVRGAASVTTSDNTITGGDGNDVIVLGTTVGTDAMLSSNDTVVFAAGFGNDTVVHFKAGALATGGDVLNLSALGGNILSTAFNVDKSVSVANEVVATNGTAALVAGLFTDSATAQTHVYIAVDTATNIGKVYQVVDAVGTGAGSVSATLAGTIDLADTLWADLTAVNFG